MVVGEEEGSRNGRLGTVSTLRGYDSGLFPSNMGCRCLNDSQSPAIVKSQWLKHDAAVGYEETPCFYHQSQEDVRVGVIIGIYHNKKSPELLLEDLWGRSVFVEFVELDS